jgi:DNA polymerase I
MRALIDGDVLVYKCGFAAQKNVYHVSLDGEYLGAMEGAKELKAELERLGEGATYEKEVVAEEVSHALHNVRMAIDRTVEETGCHDYTLILSGSGNFRLQEDSTLPYKGNRDELHKPVHYTAIKDYMYNRHPCEVANEMEGDDLMGIRQMENLGQTIICSIDKDMLMIPGHHYNLDKGTIVEQSLHQANVAFYMQLVTGDRTDNIPGLKGMGPVKAADLLNTTPRAGWWDTITELYLLQYDDPWVIWEQARLLWILRYEHEMNTPPRWDQLFGDAL